MARKNYPNPCDETFKVLSGSEAEIAREHDCDPSYIYGVKNGKEKDPFPPFLELFRSAAYAGAGAILWLDVLNAVWMKARLGKAGQLSELTAKVLEKIQSDAKALEKIFDAVADGELSESECHEILAALAKNAETNQQIKEAVLHRLGELDERKNRK